jgi:hypothetical protein
MTESPATTPIPVQLSQLSELDFIAFIFPHLSMPRRGPKCKLGYHRVFNLILWVLYAGMRWKCLPVPLARVSSARCSGRTRCARPTADRAGLDPPATPLPPAPSRAARAGRARSSAPRNRCRHTALVHLPEGGRSGVSSEPLCDDPPETDRFRAPGRQHPIKDRHADGSLCLEPITKRGQGRCLSLS